MVARDILLNIKFLAEHAYDRADERTRFSASVAIINMFEAVEWLSRQIVENWTAKELDGVVRDLYEKFKDKPELIKCIDSWSSFLERLRLARNTAQHRGIVSESDAYTLCTDGIEFIKDFLKKAVNVDYDELTYSSLIRNEKFRTIAEDTEKLYKEGRFTDCVDRAADLVSEVISELATVAGEMTGIFAASFKRINKKEYPESFFAAECKQLAQDLSAGLSDLGFAATVLQFFSYEEKVHLVRLYRIQSKQKSEEFTQEELGKKALFALSFSTNFTVKAEKILLLYQQ